MAGEKSKPPRPPRGHEALKGAKDGVSDILYPPNERVVVKWSHPRNHASHQHQEHKEAVCPIDQLV